MAKNLSEMLSPEVLQQIFQELKKDKWLGRCMRVNRNWSQNAVRILWSDIFDNYENGGEYLLAVHTYLSCLNDKEKQELVNRNIILPTPKYKKPFYDYPFFLTVFDYMGFLRACEYWAEFEWKDRYEFFEDTRGIQNSIKSVDFVELILNLLTRISPNINTLRFFSGDEREPSLYNDDVKLLFQPRYHPLLSNARSLYISGQFDYQHIRELFLKISEVCKSLKYIKFNYIFGDDKTNSDLITLINTQQNLEHLEFVDYLCFSQITIDMLKEHSRTLRYIFFDGIDFSKCKNFNELAECNELGVLKFFNCKGAEREIFESLYKATFPNLKKVEVAGCTNEFDRWAKNFNEIKVSKK